MDSHMSLMSDRKGVGHRFHPTDVELIDHFLKKKMMGYDSEVEDIAEVDVCKFEPWDLPNKSVIKSNDLEWFFFTERHWKGRRLSRATQNGQWKKTGRERKIKAPGTKNIIGTKITLVFYKGRVPNAERTNWVGHEYHSHINIPNVQKEFALFRLKKKPDGDNDVLPCDEVSEESNSVTPTYENPATENLTPEAQGNEKAPFGPILLPQDFDSSIFQSTLPSQNSLIELQSASGYNNASGYQQEDYYTDLWNSIDWGESFPKETTGTSLNTFDQPESVTMDCHPQSSGFGSATKAEAAKPQDIDDDLSANDVVHSSCMVSDSGNLAVVNASLEALENGKTCFPPAVNILDFDSHALQSRPYPHHSLMDLSSANGSSNDFVEVQPPYEASELEDDLNLNECLRSIIESSELSYKRTINTLFNIN